MLQREAGYIDARPSPTRSTKKSLATHGRTIHLGHKMSLMRSASSIRLPRSSRHTNQTTAAATNPRDIVIAAISLASMSFYLLSDARQFLFEGALTFYDVAEPFVYVVQACNG